MEGLSDDACYRAINTRDARFDGRLFIGVKTTGIYCRPICPARTPKRENVSFFASAAGAQEAGFRPCLRCRPEAAPNVAIWRGSSNTVARALALIEAGALDDCDVDALAESLGVGERQLRRLFTKHLGASPVSVAQTRRVLLAKQLIHETSLSMTDVAMASGFGSVRRFNETFQHLYGRPPSALRRQPQTKTGGEVSIRLSYRPPYDWDGVLAFFRDRLIAGVETIDGDTYARTIEVAGAQGTVAVRPAEGNALQAIVRFPKLAALPAIIARLRRLFDLAADPPVIGAHLSEDKLLAPLVRARPGLRVPGAWDGFELAVRAILGQQITVTAAIALARKLVAAHGEKLDDALAIPGKLTHLFPRPERLATAVIGGMPTARAKALNALGASVAADPQIFGPRRGLDDTIAELRKLPGIGDWTAQYIAMREMREPDAFPAADIGLMRAMAVDGTRPTAAELLKRAEHWRPWRAYAAQHLWASHAAAPMALAAE